MSYLKPVRFVFRGDKAVAQRYLRDARRLVYLLLARLPKEPLPAGRRRVKLNDQVTIEIIIAGLDVTAIIDVVGEKKIEEPIDDFVVLARTTTYPDGRDPEYPEQILRAPKGNLPWTTYFYTTTTEGYAEFPGRKGTYKFQGGTEIFPEGIRHAGNVDWRNEDSTRISWYGPSTRYWFDTWRQPSAQYGKFVFYLGQLLLDIDQWCLDNDEDWVERLVVGACLRNIDGQWWLYMMLSDMPDLDIPVQDIPGNTIYFSENYPLYDVYFRLRRMRLSYNPTEKLAERYTIAAEPSEELWYASAWRGCNPWVFNQQGNKLTTFTLPDSPAFVFTTANSDTAAGPPPAVCHRIDVSIAPDNSVSFEVTDHAAPPFGGKALAAIDYDENGAEIGIYLGRQSFDLSPHATCLYINETMVPLMYFTQPVAGYDQASVRRRIVAIDAREQLVVFDTYRLNTDTEGPGAVGAFRETLNHEIWHRGQFLVQQEAAVNTGSSGGWDLHTYSLEAMAEYPVGPIAWLWQLSANASIGSVRATLMGLAAPNGTTPFAVAETFGQFGAKPAGPGGPSTPVANFTDDNFNNNTPDLHGMRQVGSACAKDRYVVVSVRNPGQNMVSGAALVGQSLSYATGSDLPTLTGVSGDKQRYHLVWMLGMPLKEPVAPP